MPQRSPQAARKLAEYSHLPTVHQPADNRQDGASFGRLVRSVAGLLAFLAGPPAALWLAGGGPAKRLPSWHQTVDWFGRSDRAITAAGLVDAALLSLWLLWAAFAVLLLIELLVLLAPRRLSLPRLPAPLHRLVFGLAGSAALTLTAGSRLDATPAKPPVEAAAIPQQAAAQGPALIQVGSQRYVYVVERNDSLSTIAKRWLGDSGRWPEICRLNRHRHFPGGTLRDCDLIYPGWELRLPADARPPAAARPVPAGPRDQQTKPPPSKAKSLVPTPDASTGRADQPAHGVWEDHGGDRAEAAHGLNLPSGAFIPWSVATAISAAAALVWLHRRRRYVPNHEPPELPQAVVHIHQQVNRQAPASQGLLERAYAVPPLPAVAPGGVGLTGPGAHAAARAALISALADGGPGHPERQTTVVIDRPTLAELLGADSVEALTPWRRLKLTNDVDESLTIADEHLLRWARLREANSQPPPAALLLISAAPDGQLAVRAHITLGIGADRDVTGLLLGHWAHGRTVDVDSRGMTSLVTGPSQDVEPRMAVLDVDTALAALATLQEAHTGVSVAPPPITAGDQTGRDESNPPEIPASTSRQGPAQLRLLGIPRVEHLTAPGRPLRAKAAELAVYLACHPDGADTRTLGEYLVPDARIRQADQRIHTNASNLRHVLGRSGGRRPGGYVLKRGANDRYRLDPQTVDVDLWELRDSLTRARTTTPPERTTMLQRACDLYTAPLAYGCDYDWVEPYREKARQWATEAHLLLAEDLLATDPMAASAVLDKALCLDRYNEELYRAAMRVRHRLGQLEGVTALLNGLTTALRDLDAAPSQDTVLLAHQLLRDKS
ncbi:DNA-binding SARP family transcriptional activator [Micromonospora kangleipakensis]|uniref:DNA-binding SARP family transcriptional activator n=1 Tax=Micromonospora kangleipakensis TaxID=1077942 RepID=A0A4Q8BFG6_9ACTN|nr:LysM peptidoglycan-binding domain-containing protein [Micromonospora kangleipakensis]RZU76151.1 DNA-binding SARP family transcriptional activator [Micromonospora kangleipakensis]